MPILDNKEVKIEENSAKKINYPRDILGDVTVFVNKHIREVRYLNYGLGALGVVLILKNTYVLRTFTRVQDIPYMMIHKGIKLRGQVLSQDVKGVLRIKHIPWLNIKPKWMQDYSGTHSLPVELAHINVTPAGRQWLQENVVGKKMRFVVFDVQRYPDKALSAVYIPKILKNLCVNEELVRLGLCKVLNDAGSQMRIESTKQIKLLRKLIELESKADSKGIGLWKASNSNDKEKHIVIRVGTAMKNFVTLPWTLTRRGYDLIKKVFKK